MTTQTIPLASFINDQRQTVAKLSDGKQIMRVTRPRIVSWWLVFPAQGEKDCRCLKLRQAPRRKLIEIIERELLSNYTERMVSLPA